jgi:hypothetical protein
MRHASDMSSHEIASTDHDDYARRFDLPGGE